MAQSLINSGIEPESVKQFRHVLLNCLGGGSSKASATIHTVELESNDRLLLCTDGLTDMVSDEAIAAELKRHINPQAACDALIRHALENGGRDNVTAVLAAVTETREEANP